jgi:5-methylcytosine-specific restriction endonuclease McrA
VNTLAKWGGRPSRRLLAYVLRRDGYRCAWCGGTATTADHVVPRALGGSDDPANLVAACDLDNKSKGIRSRPTRTVTTPPSRPW